jgi:xanthine dehydrogenase accessory factor
VSDPGTAHRVLAALLEAREHRRPCVLATVIAYKGSTPRKGGAKMLVFEDGAIVGTIGGGAVEHHVIQRARDLCRSDVPAIVDKHLTHELGMCCGGAITVLLEPQTYTPRLLLFGAGHVAEPLAQVASLADFDVTVIDPRPELATSERFPTATRILVEEPLDVLDALELEPDYTYVIVVTHDHALDEAVAGEVLRRPHTFLGVIGSRRKREMFRKRLMAGGLGEAELDRMRTPVGLDIAAETPAEIAVSIVGELISVRRAGRVADVTAAELPE